MRLDTEVRQQLLEEERQERQVRSIKRNVEIFSANRDADYLELLGRWLIAEAERKRARVS